MSDNKPQTWLTRPCLGQYSLQDIIRTGIATIFIMMCMSSLALYVTEQIKTTSDLKSILHVEYINMTREDVYDQNNHLVLKAPDLVIDRILEFPISYDKLDMQGYILIDTATQVKYMYVRNNMGMAITKYWTTKEIEHLDVDITNQEFQEIYKDRPSRFGSDVEVMGEKSE